MVLPRSALALLLVMISALVALGPSTAQAAGRPDLVVPSGGSATQSGTQVNAVFKVRAKYAGTKIATRAGVGLYDTQSGEFTELGSVRGQAAEEGRLAPGRDPGVAGQR